MKTELAAKWHGNPVYLEGRTLLTDIGRLDLDTLLLLQNLLPPGLKEATEEAGDILPGLNIWNPMESR